ncbi:MAG TPA: gephyrin-like molybdotransferase Glp [Acidimicrobiia bacterium]|nr:gephyrin-like molybdotransferase Glp [Acidimicrobiia bacterium]
MISLTDAQARVLEGIERLAPAPMRPAEALGLVLAADVVASEAVPPFANTAMDGYAVRAADTAGASEAAPVRLRVVGELPAGRAPSTPVAAGEAIRIMTGAPIPDGADAIVMVERTARDGDDAVRIHAAAQVRDHVREAAGDIAPGTVVFGAGTVVRPAHLGVLASLDVDSVDVFPRARVAVLSTGDELVERGPLAPGQIRDGNRPMLRALVAETGAVVVDLGMARDDEAIITEAVAHAADTCDALVTSGAVSVGDYDFVKTAIESVARDRPGSDYLWAQVAIKPAKPLAFGRLGRVPVFGLPGNPVSSHVSFELFARPALRMLMGHADVHRPRIRARAAHDFGRRADGRLYVERVVLARGGDGGFVVSRSGIQASNVLSGMARANGLALLPDGEGVPAGTDLDVMVLDLP